MSTIKMIDTYIKLKNKQVQYGIITTKINNYGELQHY